MSLIQYIRVSVASAGLAVAATGTSAPANGLERSQESSSRPPVARASGIDPATAPGSGRKGGARGVRDTTRPVDAEIERARLDALLIGISRPETRLATLNQLSATDLHRPEITETILSTLGRDPATISRECADLLLRSSPFMCHALSLSPLELAESYQNLWLNLAKSASPEELSKATPEMVDAFVSLYRVHSELARPVTALEMTPSELRGNPLLRKAFADYFNLAESASVLNYARVFGVPPEKILPAVASLLKTTTAEAPTGRLLEELLIQNVTARGIIEHPEVKGPLLQQLRLYPQRWPGPEVMNSGAFAELVHKELQRDPKFASRIPPSLYDRTSAAHSPAIRAAVEATLRPLEAQLPHWALRDVPVLALERPEIRQLIRNEINEQIFAGQVSTKLSSIPHLQPFIQQVPELMRLAQEPRAFDSLSSAELSSLARINPRGFARVIENSQSTQNEAIAALNNTIKALETLGIRAFGRFDNAREIIRNRFAVADTPTKKALRALLPADFFDGVDRDTRPYAICIASPSDSDTTRSFAAVNSGYAMFDHIDRLTDHYRVLMFEPSSAKELIDALTEVRERRGVSAELMLVLGHGTQQSITLSPDPHDQARRNLYADDPALQRLGGIMRPGAAIALLSCSTASDADSGASIFDAFRRVFPSCYLFAPKGKTLIPEMKLGPNGEFRSMQYADTRTVFYNPLNQTVTETQGTPFIFQIAKMYLAQALKHPLAPYASMLLVLTGAYAALRVIRRAVRAALEASQVRSSSQGVEQARSSWLARFVTALWALPLRKSMQPQAIMPIEPSAPAESRPPIGPGSSNERSIAPFTIQCAGNSGTTIDVINGADFSGITFSIRRSSDQPAQLLPAEHEALLDPQPVDPKTPSFASESSDPLLEATFRTSQPACADSL